jgi:hypothetical protein
MMRKVLFGGLMVMALGFVGAAQARAEETDDLASPTYTRKLRRCYIVYDGYRQCTSRAVADAKVARGFDELLKRGVVVEPKGAGVAENGRTGQILDLNAPKTTR